MVILCYFIYTFMYQPYLFYSGDLYILKNKKTTK